MSKKRGKAYDLAFAVAFFLLWFFLFWKCRYGFADFDEPFYLTVPFRFCTGDKLLLHEWNLSQLSGLLLVPVMKLYMTLFDGTEGIILHFRWLFTFVWGISTVFFYYRTKCVSKIGALFSALVYMVFAPFGIMALFYDSMGIMLLLAACVILLTAENHRRVQYTVAGVLSACAVLCCPYLILLYLLFTAAAVFEKLRKQQDFFCEWLFVTVGAGIVFTLFCAMLLLAASPGQYLYVLPQVFQDPDHPLPALPESLINYCSYIAGSSTIVIPALALTVICSIIFRKRHQNTGFCLVCAAITVVIADYIGHSDKPGYAIINSIMFPFSLLGLYCFIVEPEPINRRIFCFMWIPGLVYSWVISIGSNQKFHVVAAAATVMTVASVLLAGRFIRNRKPAVVLVMFVGLLAVQIGAETFLRYETVFKSPEGIAAQTAYVDRGSEAGLYVTDDRCEYYSKRYDVVETIKNDPEMTQLLVVSPNTWYYLDSEKKIASFSAWTWVINDNTFGRLWTYYGLFPDKWPDCVLVVRNCEGRIPAFLERGFEIVQETDELILLKMIQT